MVTPTNAFRTRCSISRNTATSVRFLPHKVRAGEPEETTSEKGREEGKGRVKGIKEQIQKKHCKPTQHFLKAAKQCLREAG